MRFLFGQCLLDSGSREFFSAGQPVHLSPKAFRLLELLVEAQPNALSKAELHERLWPETFVSETNLSGLVGEVRAAIGDDPRASQFLRTVHRFGYAFAGARRERDATPRAVEYRLIIGAREVALSPGENVLGRDHDVVAWIEGKTVSRRHARIVITTDGATIEDLGSKNGTFVGGTPAVTPVALSDGVQITLGRRLMTFRVFPYATSTETEEDR